MITIIETGKFMSVPEYVADTRYRSDGGKSPLFKMSSVNRNKWAVRCFSYLTPGGNSSDAEAGLTIGK